MASETYKQRFRRAVGDPGGDNPLFEPDEIDDFFTQADEDYATASDNAKLAYAVMLGFQSLQTLYVTQVDYTANSVSEKLSDVFDHYEKLIKKWEAKLTDALASTLPGVMWGSTRVTPSRDQEYPDA